jgi:hypothetical protein
MFLRILLELALFLTPFGIFFIYRAASKDLSVRDRWPLTMLVAVGAVLAALALIIPPLLQPSQEGKCYQTPRYVDGQTIPGGMVDCDKIQAPVRDAPPPSQAPVAPRDTGRAGE